MKISMKKPLHNLVNLTKYNDNQIPDCIFNVFIFRFFFFHEEKSNKKKNNDSDDDDDDEPVAFHGFDEEGQFDETSENASS